MRTFVTYRFVIFVLCLLALGAGQKLCPVHNVPMTRKQVPIIFLEDRFNVAEWQAYTNARARLFPNSCDEIVRMANDLPLNKSGDIDWPKIPTNGLTDLCLSCM